MRFEVGENATDFGDGENLKGFMFCKGGFEVMGSVVFAVASKSGLVFGEIVMKSKAIRVCSGGRNEGILETKVVERLWA